MVYIFPFNGGWLRNNQELQKSHLGVRIIAIKGVGLHNLPVAFDLGAVRVFEKPVPISEFIKTVKELLA